MSFLPTGSSRCWTMMPTVTSWSRTRCSDDPTTADLPGVREAGPRLGSCSRKSGFRVLTTRCTRHGTLGGCGTDRLPQQQSALRPNLPQLMYAHSCDLCQLRSCLHILAVPKETVLFTRLQHG
jgi:hypothetical protein